MRADLARREPEWLARWAEASANTSASWRRACATRRRQYVLHDGPPYATGAIHYGTVLNKVLKDIVVRSQLIMGRRGRVPSRAGTATACPSSSRSRRDLGKDAKALDAVAFRERCEEHALKFVDVMRTEFKRLGCVGNWDDPVPDAGQGLRGDDRAPAGGVRARRAAVPGQEAGALVPRPPHRAGRGRGRVRGPRLAVDLRPLPDRRRPGQGRSAPARQARGVRHLDDDPWTLPANLAVVANPELDYVAHPARRRIPDRRGRPGRERSWRRRASTRRRPTAGSRSSRDGLRALEGTRVPAAVPAPRRPTPKRDYRLWFARHATLEAGTGLVHTAPGHGAEDYLVGREHGLEIFAPVDEHGRFTPEVDVRQAGGGRRVRRRTRSSSPTWRSAACCSTSRARQCATSTRTAGAARTRSSSAPPRSGSRAWATPTTRRRCATRALRRDRRAPSWIPAWGENRIRGMIEARPDWCLSRQRVWGVPIPAFRCTACRKRSARRRRSSSTWPTSSRARARTPGSRDRRPSCCPAGTARARAAAGSSRSSTTSSTSGSNRACRGRRSPRASWCRRARRSTSTSRAPTSTAAGSTRRC